MSDGLFDGVLGKVKRIKLYMKNETSLGVKFQILLV